MREYITLKQFQLVKMSVSIFQENEQRRLQEEKMEKRRKAQAEMKTKRTGKCSLSVLITKIVKIVSNLT